MSDRSVARAKKWSRSGDGAILRVLAFLPALALVVCIAPPPASPYPTLQGGFVPMVDDHFRVRFDVGMSDASRRAGIDIVRATEIVLATTDRALPGPRTTIWITADPGSAIPEVGIGGFTYPESGDIIVAVDTSARQDLSRIVRDELPLTLAHELHHSRRITRGPGYGRTIGEALVTEGLADTFAHEVFPAAPTPPWVGALDRSAERASWSVARAVLDAPDTTGEHQRWFFGTGDQPRWAGYTIGSAIVKSYLSSHPGATAASLVDVSASWILAEGGYQP
jgi:hypothetical protein